jgi:hypothetical protein
MPERSPDQHNQLGSVSRGRAASDGSPSAPRPRPPGTRSTRRRS